MREATFHPAPMRPTDLTQLPQTDPTRAYHYRDSLYAADLIAAALVQFDFFTSLAGQPGTAEQIRSRFGFAERPNDVLLTLCAANGFVVRDADGVFRISDSGREFLTGESPWNLSPYYASLKDRPVTLDYGKVLLTGKPANWGAAKESFDWHKAMEQEPFARMFTATMDCRGRLLGPALARQLDLTGRHSVLDIAGGSGIYACALVARHPALRATVLEQAPVDRIASARISELGFADRVSVAAGNMFDDPMPTDCDVHLFSNVLHDWEVPEVVKLLARSFGALPSGGLLVIHDAFINAEKTGPLAVAEYSALLMHSTQGKCYSTGEYADLLGAAGFIPGPYADTVANRGFMTAVRP
jgi:3-hydroxy-5-methyl-1-naphthoate 3-O-methyltransferase